MITSLRTRVLVTAFNTVAALAIAGTAAAQSESQHQHGAPGMPGGTGGMMGMMQGCPMMSGGGGMSGHSVPHLPPGNEKLEMQMHADMMRAIADVMTKYAARLPEKK